MKLRNHISPVVGLVVAIASLFGGSPAVAQQAYPVAPFMPYARQSCLGDRFYIQAGVQYRNIQRLGFQKTPHVIRYDEPVQDPHVPGVYYVGGRPPFGPNREGNFGTGTGVPGYQEFGSPSGVSTEDPRWSGIWIYDDGYITPVGSSEGVTPGATYLWPEGGGNTQGLGHYIGSIAVGTSTASAWNFGIFSIASTTLQVSNGYNAIYPNQPSQIGFDPAHPPNMNATYNLIWQRVMDDSVAMNPERGTPSRIWRTWGGEIQNLEFNEQIWTPSLEIGFQWTNLFDFFYGFSWFSLDKSVSRQFDTRAELWRRGFRDTFAFFSDQDVAWTPGPWDSLTSPIGGTSGNRQIMVDAEGTGGFPNRQFFEQADPAGALLLPPVNVSERVVLHTDVTVYENKFGARSWTPMYGMGRFGVTLGPLMNLIHYKASHTSREEFTASFLPPAPPAPPSQTLRETSVSNEAWLISYGLFTAVDLEIDYNNFFFRTNAQYNLSEEKQLKNSQYVWTNLNLSGYSSLLAAGVRF
jgi:hypothetical protein